MAEDQWTGRDKAEHIVVSAALAAAEAGKISRGMPPVQPAALPYGI